MGGSEAESYKGEKRQKFLYDEMTTTSTRRQRSPTPPVVAVTRSSHRVVLVAVVVTIANWRNESPDAEGRKATEKYSSRKYRYSLGREERREYLYSYHSKLVSYKRSIACCDLGEGSTCRGTRSTICSVPVGEGEDEGASSVLQDSMFPFPSSSVINSGTMYESACARPCTVLVPYGANILCKLQVLYGATWM